MTVLPRRLVSIDALRGIAALGVVMYHTNAIPGVDRRLWFGDATDAAMFFGKFGVWLFFVISGFCIHLQWVRSAIDPRVPRQTFTAFWKRRIRRLYPPYLVTLVFYTAVRYHQGVLGADTMSAWTIFLHLFMLQNLDPRTMSTMNSIYWTLAVEEQLYLLYFVFLAVRQRWGWGVTLFVAFAARAAWFALAMVVHRFWGIDIVVTQAAVPQWAVWILGALAVEATFGVSTLPGAAKNKWVAAALLVAAGVVAQAEMYWIPIGFAHNLLWFAGDLMWGLAFFVTLNWLVSFEPTWAPAGVPSAVRTLAAVGLFSYSLYLTHELVEWYLWPPIAATFHVALPDIVIVAVMVASCLVFARVFFELFEKPFLNRRPVTSLKLAEPAAV